MIYQAVATPIQHDTAGRALKALWLGLLAALFVPGWADLALLFAPLALAAAFVLFRASRKAPAAPKRWVVIDGSNVMHWRGNTADIDVVREVLGVLSARGFTSGVAFDANAGYLIEGRYLGERAFSRILGLPVDRVLVVGKGTPADPAILGAARDLGARIVTNDRYRDWAADYPEVARPGHLVRGGFRDGALWLGLD